MVAGYTMGTDDCLGMILPRFSVRRGGPSKKALLYAQRPHTAQDVTTLSSEPVYLSCRRVQRSLLLARGFSILCRAFLKRVPNGVPGPRVLGQSLPEADPSRCLYAKSPCRHFSALGLAARAHMTFGSRNDFQ